MTETKPDADRKLLPPWPGACFACCNPSGLKLRFWHSAQGVATHCTVPGTYCGFDGLVHGGIISTILDEASCWVVFARLGKLGVTQKMTTTYLRPVKIATELVVAAEIMADDGRTSRVRATISDAAGVLLAESESLWAFPRLSRIAALAEVEEQQLASFLDQCHPGEWSPLCHRGG